METSAPVRSSRSEDKIIVYIGWDSREGLAYDVARHSIMRRTVPKTVYIMPLELEHLGHILTRPIEQKDGKMWDPISEAHMATEFAISRFTVPFLRKKGWALFADSDIVCLTDIRSLFDLADDKYAVMVVKHKQTKGPDTKMDDQVQTYYSRKNWSSVMLVNCGHEAHKGLTVENLNTWPGRDLHAFKWLKDEEIGELPAEWNYLVDVNKPVDNPKIAHFTLGGPWLAEWKGGSCDQIWLDELTSLKPGLAVKPQTPAQ